MTVRSRTFDRVGLAIVLLYVTVVGSAALTSLLPPGEYGTIVWQPAAVVGLLLLWPASLVIRTTLEFDSSGVRGLLWGRRELAFSDIAAWRIRGDLLIIWLSGDLRGLATPRNLIVRPHVPLGAVGAVIDKTTTANIAELLTAHVGPAQ